MVEYQEESHARGLHDALNQKLGIPLPDAVISVEGSGIHWSCDATNRERLCSISCFDIQGTAQYLARFEHSAETRAWGRTSQKEEILSAVSDWLQGQPLWALYDRFEFVDKCKRSLARIEMQAIERCPELMECAERELRDLACGIYELLFRAGDRSCRVSYCGENESLDFVFFWDECQLFQVQVEQLGQMAMVMKRWLCDYTMPSDLEKEFPWIDTEQLAQYYEEGRGIEGEFVLSWDRVERHYREVIGRPFGRQVLDMIAKMREAGFDKTLRAGRSLYWLILSRSRRHGLRDDQPWIGFRFTKDAMEVHASLDGDTKLSVPRIELTSEVDALMKQLEAWEIN